MQPSDRPMQTLVLRPRAIGLEQQQSPVRVLSVWAAPPELRLLVMLGEAPPDASAALRVIRHRLERKRSDGMWTIGVTSARDGEGKTTLAAQLALVLGESQRARVLLVEAAMHRPTLSRLLGFRVPSGEGFSVQIARRMQGGSAPWTVLALGPGLHVLAENEAEASFPETLHSTHFRRAIEQLARVYDWIVVDAPTVLGSGDANVVEEAVDGMILAARSRVTKGADLRSAMKQLGERKAMGVVLWDAAGGKRR